MSAWHIKKRDQASSATDPVTTRITEIPLVAYARAAVPPRDLIAARTNSKGFCLRTTERCVADAAAGVPAGIGTADGWGDTAGIFDAAADEVSDASLHDMDRKTPALKTPAPV